MFRYNALSDLKTGELVTPIRNENGVIVCLNENDEEVKYVMADFDFAKTLQQRELEDGVSSEDLAAQMDIDAPEPEIIEVHTEVEKPVEVLKEVEVVKEVVKEIIKEVPILVQNENETSFRELASSIKKKILLRAGLNYDRLDNVSVDIESEVIK